MIDNIDTDRMELIGKLIKIYREEVRIFEKRRDFTMKNFCDSICSMRTLSRIERGENCKNRFVYEALLKKLNLKLKQYNSVDEEIKKTIKPLLYAIEIYNKETIMKICDKNIKVLSRIKTTAYYSELNTLFENIRLYYLQDIEINLRTMERYKKLIDLFPLQYTTLFKLLIFTRLSLIPMTDIETYKVTMKELNFINEQLPCVKMLMLHYFYITSQYVCMKDLVEELRSVFFIEKNAVRLLDVYNYSLYLYSEIEKNKREIILLEIDHLVNSYEIPRIKISEIYANIAVILHGDKKYDDSLDYFKKMLKYTDEVYIPHLIYMANCQRHLDCLVSIPILKDNILQKYSEDLQLMYNYFRFFYEVKPFVKQNILIKKIAPKLKDAALINIFRYEIFRLVEETNSYKYLYIFEKIVNQKVK